MKRVLVIAAHPDDEVYGMGGTIAKLTSEGNEVYVLIVTDGSTSQYKGHPDLIQIIENKKRETQQSALILGVKTVLYGNLPDMCLDQTPHVELNKVIENTIREIKPQIVFTHFWGDVNLDHQCIYKSTLVAVRPVSGQCVKELYAYSVSSSTEWMPSMVSMQYAPNTFVEIGGFMDKKKEAILAYETEIRDYPHARSVEYVFKQDEAAGLRCGLKFAEEFVLLRKLYD